MAKKLLLATLILVAFVFLPRTAMASEGIVRLTGTNSATRCFVMSTKLDVGTYRLLVDCRNLIYPPSGELFSYIMWATPKEGDRPVRLGALDFGKALLRATSPFTSLFVTAESDESPRTPSDRIVMRGDVEGNTFLDGENAQPPELTETPPPAASPTPKPVSSVLGLIGRATLISLILFALIVGIVIFLIRRK